MSIELVLIPVGIAVAQSVSSMLENRIDRSFRLRTVMKDEMLLQKALEQYGCHVNVLTNDNYETEIATTKIWFEKNEDGVFEAIFPKEVKVDDATVFIENLTSEYKYVLQQETYKKVIERAREKGFILETEEIQQDRTIVLTLRVNS
ncbi:hypothetical protein NP92_06090 [Anoxybacillus gonensis]|uniref:DUF1257 domain-containing protein n=1 Tax=Anoxybacillus gonensis TaxID=198467 RepID=A0AAW7TGN1_9BACL|nr:DUF1257 domain-containing protein [Anoxybacillus gonensis]AKS38150.1 hypothetical protein AFK25_06205 [Anoxybacillus gonensis]KGP60793.1 hypothetical protein NP92_06090 [Anoxybacillus gonensis]MCX8047415.1 DUF1257 domain-containing protein [Anoxybacillus gonensis]MDO0877180.1 DUF1257 domain-containing protein [Anoxybacillus gonensis]